ncbi:DUF58 domain-containing protein [Rheinheimera sp. MMS21-TC3]|uniref:DUF58 domain-containing protein n=1 Tax=Rheinheimera sp. MMS21-TC3 TaxID=3072790 RepID=UPI0028C413B3|nr:DUF58 domain-containing protein [Rheinheimera sp. MMS21-TC3]WNO61126.1 DUF58 domain-containing protein [Rheinheimera sp. MMS21-TC3]
MLNLKRRLYPHYWTWLSKWLDKRQPAAAKITLSQRIIFILPTRYGLWFGLLCVLLYLLGTNYQNNLILLVCYLLLSIWLVSIVLTFANLNGLTLSCSNTSEGFANKPVAININTKASTPRYMLQFRFVNQSHTVQKDTLDSAISLTINNKERGCFLLPRLKISSCYPFGLWRSWSYVALQQQYWVYPTPIKIKDNSVGHNTTNQPNIDSEISQDLRQYQAGDSLNQILWKRLAKDSTKPIVRLRQPIQQYDPSWVIIADLTGPALEQALSQGCQKLIDLEASQQLYGLQSARQTFGPDQGTLHLQRCLQHLAEY